MFGRKPAEYIELDLESEKPLEKVMIEVEKISSYEDVERIQKKVRDGGILLVKVRELKNKDVSELKRALERLKKTCLAIDGDIAGIGDDWVIVTSSVAKVHREGEE